MNNIQRIRALGPFKLAIHGWAFSNADMLYSRLQNGLKEVEKLPDELKGEAIETINQMALELGRLRAKEGTY